MTLLRNIAGTFWYRIACDTVMCPESIQTLPSRTALQARDDAALSGWTAATTPARPASPDYCPPCSTDRARRGEDLCKGCPGGNLYDYFNHSSQGHRIANALYRFGIRDTDDLATRDLGTLTELHQLGGITLNHIRDTVRRRPIGASQTIREAS